MAKLREALCLYVCVILSRFNAVNSIIYVENGKNVTLNPNIQGTPEDILWTFNGNKVAEHDLTDFQGYGQFKERSSIENTTGKLTVLHMTSQDSGIYKSLIQINGKLQNSENEVQVIDAVQEPNVTCRLNYTTESKTLICSVSSEFLTNFEWTGSNSLQQSGQELNISKEEKPESVFICTVKNKVSQKSTSFTLKDCLTGKPPHDNLILPHGNSYLQVILPICFIILGSAAVIYFIHKRRNKGKTGEDTNGALRNNEDSVEEDINEDGAQSENEEETEMMSDFKCREEANQALKNNHVLDDNAEEDINENEEETEETEKTTDFTCNKAVAEHYEEQDANEAGDEWEK